MPAQNLTSLGAIALCLLSVACERTGAPPTQVDRAHAAATDVPKGVPPTPAVPSSSPPAAPRAETPAPVSRSELRDLLCEPSIVRATPEQTAERFAKTGALQRTSIVPEVLQLKGQGPYHAATINYGQDGKGGWLFSNARVELAPAQSESQESVYRELDALLRDKLKKPLWSTPGAGPLARTAFRVGKTLELILSACRSDAGERVCLELGEPQGEAN